MWSVGCIFAEMLTREKLFPGQEQEEQLQMIIEMLGYPEDQDELEILEDFKDKEQLKKIGKDAKLRFKERFHECPPAAVDLLRRMLTFDPKKRITVEQALEHEYLSALHCTDDEPQTTPVSAYDFDFEIFDLKREDYKDLLYEEVMLYQSEEKIQEYLLNKQRFPNGILAQRFGDKILKAASGGKD
jgi:mitogen-activated protein kinase 1/3